MNRLRHQILLLAIVLVSAVSLTILISVWISTAKYTQKQITGDIALAERVFDQILEERQSQLTASARILTLDFGFRQAVATWDIPTIKSALLNQGDRISANFLVLLNPNGELVTSIVANEDSQAEIDAMDKFDSAYLLASSQQEGASNASFVIHDKRLYQVIVIPVRAPNIIAWAGIGFRMDADLAQQLLNITNLNVSFVQKNASETRIFASTLEDENLAEAIEAHTTIDQSFRIPLLKNQQFSSSSRPISDNPNGPIEAILTASLSEAFADFDQLRDAILVITIIIIGLAAIGSAFLSNNLAGPLAELEGIARRMAQGDYQPLPKVKTRTREIDALFSAFRSMGDEIKEREERILFQATHDPLTGLLNRAEMIRQLEDLIHHSTKPFLLLSININGFRHVNDTFGPAVGDKCLIAVANRLLDLGDEVLAARSGADEFHLVCSPEIEETMKHLGKRIEISLCKSFRFDSLNLNLTFSIGAAIFPDNGNDAHTLSRRAGIALDKVRSESRGLGYYEDGEEEAHLDRLALLEDLKKALEKDDGQLRMYYQPKQNLKTGEIEKCEALIRWIHPERKFVSPDLFVALAEQSGLIARLTDWVILTVIKQVAVWQADGIMLQAAINISAQDLEREELLPMVLDELGKHALAPDALSFELTERDMMSDAEKAMHLMENFTRRGFQLSVDDYGIGQSSLSKLKQMPVSEIKIDKSFVQPLEESESDRIIVRSTIELGHRFNLKVIAEGVETQKALDLLHAMGCDFIQGYFLARPMPPGELNQWLAEREPALPSDSALNS